MNKYIASIILIFLMFGMTYIIRKIFSTKIVDMSPNRSIFILVPFLNVKHSSFIGPFLFSFLSVSVSYLYLIDFISFDKLAFWLSLVAMSFTGAFGLNVLLIYLVYKLNQKGLV